VIPSEAERLAEPQPHGRSDRDESAEATAFRGGEQNTRLLGRQWLGTHMKKRLLALLLVIFVVSATLLLVFFRGASQGTVAFEVAKALIQLGVVAVVGAAVSWALAEYQLEQARHDNAQEREHQEDVKAAELRRKRYEYRDELLTTTLRRVVVAYASAKKARRLLRAHVGVGKGAPGLVRITEYDGYLEMVNDAQLDLESVKGDVKTSAAAFSDAQSIEGALENMEQYLGRVVKEYEEHRHLVEQQSGGLQLAELTTLSDFL
jgi:hypothetical protein